MREHYWPRLVHVLPFGYADEPGELPEVITTRLERIRRPGGAGPAVMRWRGDPDAPRYLLGWRRSGR
jgi:hypothetical protein